MTARWPTCPPARSPPMPPGSPALPSAITCSAAPPPWPACAKARGTTIRSQLVSIAARIARHGRGHITMHLPEGWHRQADWMNLFEAACGPPAAAA